MAEDDKYVPSKGNPILDVASQKNSGLHAALIKEQEAYEKKRDAERPENIRSYNAHRAKSMEQDGLEYDKEGTLRSSGPNGYENSFDYRRKEKTKADRAHITERTWGKFNRGETLDMYGRKQGGGNQMGVPKVAPPKKKSDITYSMSPEYGHFKSKLFNGSAAGNVASGLMPWISRFNPTACGPVRVSSCGFYGGVIQANIQEAANNGFPVKIDNTWGNA